jgi:V/A-type H+-transporting ATPase subunit I
MFKPRKMTRTLILGAQQDVEATIELLHHLNIIHIIDYTPESTENEIQLGSPTEQASEISQQLLKLRSSAKLLTIQTENLWIGEHVSEEQIKRDIALKVQDLELSALSLIEIKNRIEEHYKKIDDRIRQLAPFTAIDIPLEAYQGYDHVTVFTGYVSELQRLREELPGMTAEYELFSSENEDQMIALFIAKEYTEKAKQLLDQCGFSEVKLPEGKGIPGQFIDKWKIQQQELSDKLVKTTKDILEFRERYTEFILASEEYLSIEVQKAEAPVRFGSTENSFFIDCWIPTHEVQRVKDIIEEKMAGAVYLEEFKEDHGEEPPTLLQNAKPVRRFEFLLDMYSTPNYRDIDPSFILSFIFPLFFGLMVGDVGYGVLLIVFGIIFMKKFKDSEGLSNIGWYIIVAGVFAFIFGLFLFGDCFGLAFQTPPGEEASVVYSWSSLLAIHIPIPSVIHKMEAFGLTQLLVISIIAGTLHLGLGLIFGFITERKHSARHAVTKIGLLCVLAALAFLIFVMADWTIGQWLKPLKGTVLEPMLWAYLIPAVKSGVYFGSLLIPYVTIVLGAVGIGIIVVATGGFGLIEVLEITSHLISYTRLAAICVAKGAMAFAFNLIGLGLILSGNIVIGIIGVILIVLMQLIVFALGSLSSGIQAIRLHYVEFFMKFYKGEGVKFNPFGYIRKYTTAGKT